VFPTSILKRGHSFCFTHCIKQSPWWPFAPSVEGRRFEPRLKSSQILTNWHLLLPWLAFIM